MVALTLTTWTALTALGTIGAVLTALYLNGWREWRRRPSLSLAYEGRSHAGDWIEITPARGSAAERPTLWIRFRVGNRQGKSAADDVEVLVVRVDVVDTKSDDRLSLRMGNLPLAWSNSSPKTTRITLPGGIERHVDAVVATKHPTEEKADFALCVEPGYAPLDPPVDPLETERSYEVEVAVTARNARAVFYTFRLTFDGTWGTVEHLHNHLDVGPIRPGRLPEVPRAQIKLTED